MIWLTLNAWGAERGSQTWFSLPKHGTGKWEAVKTTRSSLWMIWWCRRRPSLERWTDSQRASGAMETSRRVEKGSTSGRQLNECALIGVTRMAGTAGFSIDAPADMEYAVLPVGVEIIKPSGGEWTHDLNALLKLSRLRYTETLHSTDFKLGVWYSR